MPSQPWTLALFSALQLLSAVSGDLEVGKKEGKGIDHVSLRLLLLLTSDHQSNHNFSTPPGSLN